MIKKINSVKQSHILALQHNENLYESISEYCLNNQIQNGTISAIGALQNVNLGYYDQSKKKYNTLEKNEPVEIVHCLGNISLKEGEIFVHLHISVADKENKLWGGHLMAGSKIFACEVSINELEGEPFTRHFDKTTGLFIWKNNA